MKHPVPGRRAGLSVCAATALVLLASCSAGEDNTTTDPAPTTSESASPTPPTPEPEPEPSPEEPRTPSAEAAEEPEAEPTAEAMPASEPATITVPAIDVDSQLMQLGLQDNGLIEVPPYHYGSPPGWYTHSPTPGQIGPAVILGHRNGLEGGPGIFADLPQIQIGDTIDVTRQDGTVATFTIYRTDLVDKGEDFPTLDVYGNTTGPEIRLITCDGLNSDTGILEENFIAYGELEG